MIRVSAYGRLGADPKPLTTSSGKPMARASIAVDVTAYNGETPDSEWFQVIAFGRTAEDLLRCQKGNLVAISGSLTRTRWTKDGHERTAWQITAEDLHASRTVRPSGGKKREAAPSPAPVAAGSRPGMDEDDIPF
jgi:single-strand DNA-binding protein